MPPGFGEQLVNPFDIEAVEEAAKFPNIPQHVLDARISLQSLANQKVPSALGVSRNHNSFQILDNVCSGRFTNADNVIGFASDTLTRDMLSIGCDLHRNWISPGGQERLSTHW